MTRLFAYPASGNCYKALLAMRLTGTVASSEICYVDILAGESRTADFLSLNPAGQVPVLVLDDGSVLTESHAIVWLVTSGSSLMPGSSLEQAQIIKWMSFEQYLLEPKLGVARYWLHSRSVPANRCPVDINGLLNATNAALNIIEGHLRDRKFFVGEAPSAADIALFGYTPLAGDVGIDLANFPAVAAWCERMRDLPGFFSIEEEIALFEKAKADAAA